MVLTRAVIPLVRPGGKVRSLVRCQNTGQLAWSEGSSRVCLGEWDGEALRAVASVDHSKPITCLYFHRGLLVVGARISMVPRSTIKRGLSTPSLTLKGGSKTAGLWVPVPCFSAVWEMFIWSTSIQETQPTFPASMAVTMSSFIAKSTMPCFSPLKMDAPCSLTNMRFSGGALSRHDWRTNHGFGCDEQGFVFSHKRGTCFGRRRRRSH